MREGSGLNNHNNNNNNNNILIIIVIILIIIVHSGGVFWGELYFQFQPSKATSRVQGLSFGDFEPYRFGGTSQCESVAE